MSTLESITATACKVLRRAEANDQANLPTITEKVATIVDRAIKLPCNDDTGLAYLPSFAHTDDALAKDPMKGKLGGQGFDLIANFEAQILGLRPSAAPPARGTGIAGFVLWTKELDQLHPQTTPLARFRLDSINPSAVTHPTANIIYHARCEVRDNWCCNPIRLALSSDASCLALATAAGYKERDPYVHCWFLGGDEEDAQFQIEPGLAHLATHLEIDSASKLPCVADRDRVKSYSWWDDSGKPLHTLNSDKYPGPIALMVGGQLLELDSLETHSSKKRIWNGKYKGFENSWRDVDCDKEYSTGSEPTATIPLADAGLAPLIWRWHQPTQRMLCAKNPEKRHSLTFVALDLEHGGKVATRYIGHGGRVSDISISEEDPNSFVTACADGCARLYDVRLSLPSTLKESEAHVSHGNPVVWTGGHSTESVKLWNVRSKNVMYELSTGNNAVNSLVWNPRNTTLYAAAECSHVDHVGYHHGYRPATPLKSRRGRDAKEAATAFQRDESMEDDDRDEDEDDTDEGGGSDGKSWPNRAYYMEDFFSEMYDAGTHRLFRYVFKETADPSVFPAYGDAAFMSDEGGDDCTTQ